MPRLKFIHEWMHSTSYLMGKLHTVDHRLFHNFQQQCVFPAVFSPFHYPCAPSRSSEKYSPWKKEWGNMQKKTMNGLCITFNNKLYLVITTVEAQQNGNKKQAWIFHWSMHPTFLTLTPTHTLVPPMQWESTEKFKSLRWIYLTVTSDVLSFLSCTI